MTSTPPTVFRRKEFTDLHYQGRPRTSSLSQPISSLEVWRPHMIKNLLLSDLIHFFYNFEIKKCRKILNFIVNIYKIWYVLYHVTVSFVKYLTFVQVSKEITIPTYSFHSITQITDPFTDFGVYVTRNTWPSIKSPFSTGCPGTTPGTVTWKCHPTSTLFHR